MAFWFREGTYQFQEVNLPPGYEAAYEPVLTIYIPMDWPDFSLLNIIRFDLAITKDAPDGCVYPGTDVTYTYTVTNKGPASVAPVVEDLIQGNPTPYEPVYQSGDTDSDGLVDVGEAWIFTLKVPLPIDTPPGTIGDTATVSEPHADDDNWWYVGILAWLKEQGLVDNV